MTAFRLRGACCMSSVSYAERAMQPINDSALLPLGATPKRAPTSFLIWRLLSSSRCARACLLVTTRCKVGSASIEQQQKVRKRRVNAWGVLVKDIVRQGKRNPGAKRNPGWKRIGETMIRAYEHTGRLCSSTVWRPRGKRWKYLCCNLVQNPTSSRPSPTGKSWTSKTVFT